MNYLTTLGEAYFDALRRLDRKNAARLLDGVWNDHDLADLYEEVFRHALVRAGEEWEADRLSVAVEHYITEATRQFMAQIKSQYATAPESGLKVVGACASSEMHCIGLQMVLDLLELSGWDALDIGPRTPIEAVVEVVSRSMPDVLCLSCMMPNHVRDLDEVVRHVRASGLSPLIYVGGRAFVTDPSLFLSLGVDGSFASAREAAIALTSRFDQTAACS